MHTPVNQLVEFCLSKYDRTDKCEACNNENCEGCVKCLENIHYHTSFRDVYDCKNLIYCYVCHYIYRYSSEIEHLLDKYKLYFSKINNLKICSIGCGPCSELFGILQFRQKNQLNFNVNFKGFEINRHWEPIHQYIYSKDKVNFSFEYNDVFEYYKSDKEYPNLIILNYVLSDIALNGEEKVNIFIDKLVELFVMVPECTLLINDINLGITSTEPRLYYSSIIDKIIEKTSVRAVRKFHFANSQRGYFQYGELNPDNSCTSFVMPETMRFFPWTECRSAQLIILKS